MALDTMTRSKRMQPVQDVAQRREQEAIRKLGQTQQQLDAQRAKLEELRGYRDQYARQFEDSGDTGLGAIRMRDYRVFLGRLNEAIHQQETVVAQCDARHQQSREQWIAVRSHTRAIGKVMDNFVRQERRQQDKQEQREQDERAPGHRKT
ncbi:MAG: flagellar export protein FliJ [Thiogranum sp.]|nr:flagellar export protein FliJ [Thiogranum sp.]